VISLLAVASLLSMTSLASATTFTIGLDFEFSGASAPVSPITPWVTITLDDAIGGPNTVRLTVEATNLTGGTNGESIAALFDPVAAGL
jgi:hypothetical protein